MPTIRRTTPATSSTATGLTIPADALRQLGWTARTPLEVQCHLAWTSTPEGHVARCLTFTLTAVLSPGRRRPARKAA